MEDLIKQILEINKGNLFYISFEQYVQFKDFLNDHKNCIFNEMKYNKFGTIGGGYHLIFSIKNNNNIISINVYAKCEGCGKKIQLKELNKIKNNEIYDNDDLKNKYNSFLLYTLKLDKTELNNFFNEFENAKGNVKVTFIPNGLGRSIVVNDKYITNTDSW